MIDQELLKVCIINSWSIVPRMMLINSMIENGWEEVKAMEAFEPPTVSQHLPLTYNVNIGSGTGIGRGGGHIINLGSGRGYGNNCGFLMIVKQQ